MQATCPRAASSKTWNSQRVSRGSLGTQRCAAGIVGSSIPPYVVIAFELTILFGGLSTALGMVLLGRLPRFRPSAGYDPRFSNDRFGVAVQCAPGRGASVAGILRGAGAEEVRA